MANGAVVAATAPALPATLPANTSLNYMHPNFELRPSAMTFTPSANVHRTPIKATSAAAAAASEDEELCMWLQQKAWPTVCVASRVCAPVAGRHETHACVATAPLLSPPLSHASHRSVGMCRYGQLPWEVARACVARSLGCGDGAEQTPVRQDDHGLRGR